MMSFPYLFFLCFRINWLPSDVRIRTHPAPVRQTWRTMGGYGIPDDANVHFLSPITAISICLETSQGKKKTNKCRLICALPLDWWILEKEKKVNCESGRPNFHSPLCVVVAHSRPAIPCSVLFLKNAFPNPTSPFFYFIMTSLWLSIILRHLYSFGGCYFYDGSFKPPGRRKNNQNVFIYFFFFGNAGTPFSSIWFLVEIECESDLTW